MEPSPISGKVYTEHYISNLLSFMHRLRIEYTYIEDLK